MIERTLNNIDPPTVEEFAGSMEDYFVLCNTGSYRYRR